MKEKNRRKFIQLLCLGIFIPNLSSASNIIFKDSSCHKKGKHKILVTYASEYGSTQGVAKAIAKSLCDSRTSVDVIYIKHIKRIKGYQQVIIGSPIQYDTWLDEAKVFLSTYETQLSTLPVSYFFTCLTLSKRSKKTRELAQSYANDLLKLHPRIKPRNIGQFAGVLNYSKFSAVFRLIARGMFATFGVKEGDYRDWYAIKRWSSTLKIKG